MAYISQWLNDQLQAKQADLVVDDTLTNLRQRSGLLDAYMPLKTYNGRKFLAYVVREVNAVASIVSFGGELPTAATGSFRKITAEMLKLGLSYNFDEETQWDMKEALEVAGSKGIQVQDVRTPEGMIIRGVNNDLAAYLFGSIERIVKSTVDLLDALTWQVITTGQINYTDPRTNTTTVLDFREPSPSPSYNHFPSALATTARWDQASTATGIQDLYNLLDTYIDSNGFPPDQIVMSRKLRNLLMQQTSTKNSASSLTVTQVGQVSPNMLEAVLEARGIPPIVTFDERYETIDGSGNTAIARFLPTNMVAFLTKNVGERAMGSVLEAGDSGVNGIYTIAREIQKIPPIDAIQAVCTALPLVAKPRLLMAQQVTDAF